jgi:rod shape-determining protein MreD
MPPPGTFADPLPGGTVTAREAARVVLVVVLFVVVQETLVLDLRIGGVHPDIMILLPIVAGIVGGPARGATMGFGAGLAADLFLPTPFGLSALVGSLIGFGVGVATLALDRSALWLAPLAALGASALAVGTYAVLGSVLGQPQMLHVDLFRIIVVVSVTNAVLAIPALRLVTWALPAASIEGVPTSAVSSGSLR